MASRGIEVIHSRSIAYFCPFLIRLLLGLCHCLYPGDPQTEANKQQQFSLTALRCKSLRKIYVDLEWCVTQQIGTPLTKANLYSGFLYWLLPLTHPPFNLTVGKGATDCQIGGLYIKCCQLSLICTCIVQLETIGKYCVVNYASE